MTLLAKCDMCGQEQSCPINNNPDDNGSDWPALPKGWKVIKRKMYLIKCKECRIKHGEIKP